MRIGIWLRLGSNQAVNKTLRKVFDIAGLPQGLIFHTSRHTCATILGQAGIDIFQKLLEHTKAQTTAIYRETDRKSILAGLQKPARCTHE